MRAKDELSDDPLWWVTIDDGLRWLPVIACWWTGQDDQVGLDPGHFSSARILPGVIVIAGSWFQTSPPKKNMTRLRSSTVGWLGWRVLSTTRARLSTRSSFKKCHSPSSQFIQPHPRPGSRWGTWGTLGAPWGTLTSTLNEPQQRIKDEKQMSRQTLDAWTWWNFVMAMAINCSSP
jgi:hypothetical protein